MKQKLKKNPNTRKRMNQHYKTLIEIMSLEGKEERFAEWIMDYLKPLIPATGKILDIGCGMGRLLHEVGKFTDAKLYGIDISWNAIVEAKKRYPYEFRVADAEHLAGEYDLIINSQTLEHVDDPEKIILRMKDHSKRLFITVPYPNSSLDNGVKLHYWRFEVKDFEKLLDDPTIKKHGINHMVIWT